MARKFIRLFFAKFSWFVPFWYGLTMRLNRLVRLRLRNVPVKTYADSRLIAQALNYGLSWEEDPIHGLFDTLDHPMVLQDRINKGITDGQGFGDCDDHGIYWCTALMKSGLVDEVYFCSLMYEKPSGKITGHVVCVLRHGTDWAWCDYTPPRPVDGKWGWVAKVAERRGSKPIAALMIRVPKIGRRDTPRFGAREHRLL